MAAEISTVPAWGADVRGSAPTLGLLFPDPEPAWRGSPATSDTGMLHRDGLVHVALGVVDITRDLVAKSFLGSLVGKDLPAVTRRLPATIGVVWM